MRLEERYIQSVLLGSKRYIQAHDSRLEADMVVYDPDTGCRYNSKQFYEHLNLQ